MTDDNKLLLCAFLQTISVLPALLHTHGFGFSLVLLAYVVLISFSSNNIECNFCMEKMRKWVNGYFCDKNDESIKCYVSCILIDRTIGIALLKLVNMINAVVLISIRIEYSTDIDYISHALWTIETIINFIRPIVFPSNTFWWTCFGNRQIIHQIITINQMQPQK